MGWKGLPGEGNKEWGRAGQRLVWGQGQCLSGRTGGSWAWWGWQVWYVAYCIWRAPQHPTLLGTSERISSISFIVTRSCLPFLAIQIQQPRGPGVLHASHFLAISAHHLPFWLCPTEPSHLMLPGLALGFVFLQGFHWGRTIHQEKESVTSLSPHPFLLESRKKIKAEFVSQLKQF